MKSILAIFTLTVSSFAHSEMAQLPVSCSTPDKYHQFTEEAGEDTGFVGAGKNTKGSKIYTVVTGNPDFGNWTVALINPESNTVCIVSFGEKFSYSTE